MESGFDEYRMKGKKKPLTNVSGFLFVPVMLKRMVIR